MKSKNLLMLIKTLLFSLLVTRFCATDSVYAVTHFRELTTNSTNKTDGNSSNSGTENNKSSNTTNDQIEVLFYTSKITAEGRKDYNYWIMFKNSLYNKPKYVKTTRYFTPEEDDYLDNLDTTGWYFLLLGAFFLLIFIIYIVLRFVFHYCKGPKANISIWFGRLAFFFVIFGFIVSMTLSGVSIGEGLKVQTKASDTLGYLKEQITFLEKNVKDIETNVEKLQALKQVEGTDYIESIYQFDVIKKENLDVIDKSNKLHDKLKGWQGTRLIWILSLMITIALLTGLGYLFYSLRFPKIVELISMLILLSIIPYCLYLAYNNALVVGSIDLCQDVSFDLQNKIGPIQNQGLGNYIYCPSKKVVMLISTSRYELSRTFDYIFAKADKETKDNFKTSIGTIKRNNALFEDLKAKYVTTELTKKFDSLIILNNILTSLEKIMQCQAPKNFVNYTEEHYCAWSITYLFNSIMLQLFSLVGILLLSVGVNKICILADKEFDKLREGNLNDELLEEEQSIF